MRKERKTLYKKGNFEIVKETTYFDRHFPKNPDFCITWESFWITNHKLSIILSPDELEAIADVFHAEYGD